MLILTETSPEIPNWPINQLRKSFRKKFVEIKSVQNLIANILKKKDLSRTFLSKVGILTINERINGRTKMFRALDELPPSVKSSLRSF